MARGHAANPVIVQFYGTPPILLTVGRRKVVAGKDLLGIDLAVRVDVVLWSSDTAVAVVFLIELTLVMDLDLDGRQRSAGY